MNRLEQANRILDVMKKLLFILISTLLSLSLLFCSCSVTSDNSNLEICTDDFEAINDLLLSIETNKDRLLFSVIVQNEENTEINNFPLELDTNQSDSLNRIANAFSTDFSFIEITENRIAYGGEGSDMFVYSINGKAPKYFYYKGDNINFSVKELENNWYYCHAKIR